MARRVVVLLGTAKGVFFVESGAARRDWTISGPHCDSWPINHVKADPATGAIYAGGGTQWHGIDVWKTTDLGKTWSRSAKGIAHDDGDEGVDSVWSFGFGGGTVYAGVRPAGLFASRDGGDSWDLVRGLTDHPTRKDWPAGGAGLTLHHIVTDAADPDRIWVGISSAGVFHSDDGGATWGPRNTGVRCDFMGDGATYPEIGQCVHGIARAAGDGDVMYQQNHCGMYRSDNGGARWDSIENGLPSDFGFCVAAHPRDPDTAWFLPMNSAFRGRHVPEGKAAVWRTRDGGKGFSDLRSGLPQEHCYFTVLRQAMATDAEPSVGVYFGTNSGTLYGSDDEGDTWRALARDLPLIYSVETLTLDA